MLNIAAKVVVAFCFLSILAGYSKCAIPSEGGDITGIVVSDRESPVQKFCSNDLQRILQATSDGKCGIYKLGMKLPAGRSIYIGCYPQGFPLAEKISSLEEEGIILYVSSEYIVCIGKTPRGTYYAVQELLYHIGYRNIWPGKYGECLPARGKIKLGKNLTILHNPSFMLRGGHSVHLEAKVGQKKFSCVNVKELTEWAARNMINRYKAGFPRTWTYGDYLGGGWVEIANHSVQDVLLPASYFKEHPEYFSLVNGKRMGKHPNWGTTVLPCVSNPKVIDRFTDIILKYFRDNPNAKRYLIGACDEPSYWCECKSCKALDVLPVDWANQTKKDRLTYGKMSDRWFYLVNEVARRVAKEFPDKWIATYSYGSTREQPTKYLPEKNVMIEYCYVMCRKHDLFDKSCPTNKLIVDEIKKWQKIAPTLSFYGYLEYQHWGVPEAFFKSCEDLYQSLYKMGIRYISDEIDTDPYASPAYLGLWARTLWDVNTDWKKYLDEFCTIVYGNAGKDMKRFWLYQQAIFYQCKVEHGGDIPERFTPVTIARSMEMLNKALSCEISSDQAARIERTKIAVHHAAYYMYNKLANGGNKAAWLKMAKEKEAIEKIAAKYDFPLNMFFWNSLGGQTRIREVAGGDVSEYGSYKFPAVALGGKVITELKENWLFRKDPENVGEDQKWYLPTYSLEKFKNISTGDFWENQGYSKYNGVGWYVNEVELPESSHKRIWLLFGAVDDSWTLWINGEYAGKSSGDPNVIWDKPVAVDITDRLKAGKKIRIAVRVHDTAGMGGIWKPVSIVGTN